LIHYVVNAETDPSAFKKIVAINEKKGIRFEMRDLWVTRMKHRRAELAQAALDGLISPMPISCWNSLIPSGMGKIISPHRLYWNRYHRLFLY
jgi:hypothetical protein